MSNSFDVTGTGEKEGKGKTPKEEITCKSSLGHTVKSCMTVICFLGGALSDYDPNKCIIFGKNCRRVQSRLFLWLDPFINFL